MRETTVCSDERQRLRVLNTYQEMHRRGMTISSVGCVSVRSEARVWITPTRTPPNVMTAADVCVVTLEGRCLGGDSPSRELPLHLEVYSHFPGIRAVVHTHSPWATAWSYRCQDLDLVTEELKYHGITKIRCTPEAPAGSTALARGAAEALQNASVALLAQHGVVAMGTDANAAMSWAELAEQQAHIQWLLHLDDRQGHGLGPTPRIARPRTKLKPIARIAPRDECHVPNGRLPTDLLIRAAREIRSLAAATRARRSGDP